jgi:Mrp family chromosome partitioning ATPase
MIIVDTPPSFLLTDAHRVSGYCNSVLYVVRHNYTPKRILRRLDQTLDIHPLKNAFLVFNGIGKRGFASYGYGYGYHENKYSSKYGYG